MTRTQLIAYIAEKCKVSKRLAADMVTSMLEAVVKTVKKGDSVTLQGFGTWKSTKRAARMGVNPRNPKEKIKIPATKVVSFKAGSEFKKAVKGA